MEILSKQLYLYMGYLLSYPSEEKGKIALNWLTQSLELNSVHNVLMKGE